MRGRNRPRRGRFTRQCKGLRTWAYGGDRTSALRRGDTPRGGGFGGTPGARIDYVCSLSALFATICVEFKKMSLGEKQGRYFPRVASVVSKRGLITWNDVWERLSFVQDSPAKGLLAKTRFWNWFPLPSRKPDSLSGQGIFVTLGHPRGIKRRGRD